MIGHQTSSPRAFKNRPQRRKKGAGKGRICKPWPWIAKVVADAVCLRVKGTVEAWVFDRRRPLSYAQFALQVDLLLPGFWSWRTEHAGKPGVDDLFNRVYKMYYSGTSDRGEKHDPKTRAVCESGEHWHKHVSPDSPLWKLHEQICRSQITVVENWEQYL